MSFNIDRLSQLQERVRAHMLSSGYPQDADDAAQEYALQILQGKCTRQRIDFFCIDFIRRYHTGQRSKTDRRPVDLSQRMFEARASFDGASQIENEIDYKKIMEKIMVVRPTKIRRILVSHFFFGERASDIAIKEKVSQQRISQILGRSLFILRRLINSKRLRLK